MNGQYSSKDFCNKIYGLTCLCTRIYNLLRSIIKFLYIIFVSIYDEKRKKIKTLRKFE